MDPDLVLLHLAAWPTAAPDQLLTVYLDLSPGKLDTVLSLLDGDSLGRDPRPLIDEARAAAQEGALGLIWVEALDQGRRESFRWPAPLPTAVMLGQEPWVEPLAAAFDADQPWIVAVVGDRRVSLRRARFGAWTGRRVEVTETLRRTVTQEARAQLDAFLHASPRALLALVGEPRRRDALEAEFGPELMDRVALRLDRLTAPAIPTGGRSAPGDGDWPPRDWLVADPTPPREGVPALLEWCDDPRRVALGWASATAAILGGEAVALHLIDEEEPEGWRCEACERFGHGAPPPLCVGCGATVVRWPLRALLEPWAMARGIKVVRHERHVVLEWLGGVGALLRGPGAGAVETL